MIRAVYRDGKIEPVEQVPADWREGDELVIDALPSTNMPDETFDEWVAEVNAAAAKISDDDHDRVEAAIGQHRAEAKEWMRREMGLSE